MWLMDLIIHLCKSRKREMEFYQRKHCQLGLKAKEMRWNKGKLPDFIDSTRWGSRAIWLWTYIALRGKREGRPGMTQRSAWLPLLWLSRSHRLEVGVRTALFPPRFTRWGCLLLLRRRPGCCPELWGWTTTEGQEDDAASPAGSEGRALEPREDHSRYLKI